MPGIPDQAAQRNSQQQQKHQVVSTALPRNSPGNLLPDLPQSTGQFVKHIFCRRQNLQMCQQPQRFSIHIGKEVRGIEPGHQYQRTGG